MNYYELYDMNGSLHYEYIGGICLKDIIEKINIKTRYNIVYEDEIIYDNFYIDLEDIVEKKIYNNVFLIYLDDYFLGNDYEYCNFNNNINELLQSIEKLEYYDNIINMNHNNIFILSNYHYYNTKLNDIIDRINITISEISSKNKYILEDKLFINFYNKNFVKTKKYKNIISKIILEIKNKVN